MHARLQDPHHNYHPLHSLNPPTHTHTALKRKRPQNCPTETDTKVSATNKKINTL